MILNECPEPDLSIILKVPLDVSELRRVERCTPAGIRYLL